jgi:hypothetical protein
MIRAALVLGERDVDVEGEVRVADGGGGRGSGSSVIALDAERSDATLLTAL